MGWIGKLGLLGPMAVFAIVMPPISGLLLLGTMHEVGPWLRDHQPAGQVLYLTAFVVLGGLALLPTYAQSLLGAWAFGFVAGLPLVLAGFLGAALLNYAVASRVSRARLETLLAESPRWHGVYRILLRGNFWRAVLTLTLVRLPPNAPFAATNVALAAMRAPIAAYALGTLAGLAPRAAAVVYVGAGLSVLDLTNRAQTEWFLAGAVLTLAAVVLIGWLANRALERVDAEMATHNSEGGGPLERHAG